MNQRIFIYIPLAIMLVVMGCGPKMMFPPEIDLREYESVGLIDFSSEYEGEIGRFVTQKFLEEISESQRGVRIIELGSLEDVLESVGRDRLDPETVQEIGIKHELNSVITGNLDISDVKPKISLSAIVRHMSVEAEVEAALSVKLLDTERGATIWTDSAREKRTVAHVSVFSGGPVIFDAEDPEEAYGDLAESLVEEVTTDLRVSYRRK